MSGSDLSSGPGADTVRDLVGRCGAGAGFGHMGEIDIGRNRRGGQCDHRKFGVFRRRMVLCQGCCSEFCDFGSIYRCGYVQRKATQEIHGGLSALLGLGLCRRVAAMKQYRGSFTVEASFIISWFCLLIGTVILLAFYIHDYVVICAVADEAAVHASLSLGRYFLTDSGETDITALLEERDVPMTLVYEWAYQRMERSLLCVSVDTFQINESKWADKVEVSAIGSCRLAGIPVQFKIISEAPVINSQSLSRRPEGEEETGGE